MSCNGEDGTSPGFAFLRTPWALRIWVSTAVLGAAVLPLVLHPFGHQDAANGQLLTLLVVVGLSVVNVEIGRLLEGGRSDSQRPHKALSAWTFAAALLLPTWWLLPITVVTYAHAWWRGLRVTPWKWVGSAAYLVLAGLAAGLTASTILGTETNLMAGDGLRGLSAVLAAAAMFLAVETLTFHGSAYLNDAADESWLRDTLASASFYLTETGVLVVGGLSAAIWTGGGWFVVLLVPVYAITQRAALHEPLRERAEHDDKTGALRFESWRRLALAGGERSRRRGHAWAVLFADLDRFKQFNDTWGHLRGDEALVAVTAAIRDQLRADDLLGRFGGEEFCVFLPDVSADEAYAVAERIRRAVAAADVVGTEPITISIGLAVAPPAPEPIELAGVLAAADRALFTAKSEGRDCTRVELLRTASEAPVPS